MDVHRPASGGGGARLVRWCCSPTPPRSPSTRSWSTWPPTYPGPPGDRGLASAGFGPGGNRLVLDEHLHDHGAVGVLLGRRRRRDDRRVARAAGRSASPFTVTRAERNVHLRARRAPRARAAAGAARGPRRARAASWRREGLHLGSRDRRAQGRLRAGRLPRPQRARRRPRRAAPSPSATRSSVGDDRAVPGPRRRVGRRGPARCCSTATRPSGALVFTCNGRGMRLFGEPDHDAEVVAESIGSARRGRHVLRGRARSRRRTAASCTASPPRSRLVRASSQGHRAAVGLPG